MHDSSRVLWEEGALDAFIELGDDWDEYDWGLYSIGNDGSVGRAGCEFVGNSSNVVMIPPVIAAWVVGVAVTDGVT